MSNLYLSWNNKWICNIFIDCPGTESNDAGKSSICAGCPNKTICASGITRQSDSNIDLIKERLSTVKNKLLVLSGKGGVGKSTITSLISRFLALNNPDINVCIFLTCDINILNNYFIKYIILDRSSSFVYDINIILKILK